MNAAIPQTQTQMHAAAYARITKARAALLLNPRWSFYGACALALEAIPRDDIATARTDGKRLFYSPSYVMSLTERQLLGLIAHEVMHVANKHHTRRGKRDLRDWNIAADYAENLDITRAGLELPEGALLDAKYAGLGAEAIYRELRADAEQTTQKQPQPQPQASPGGASGDSSEQSNDAQGASGGDNAPEQGEPGEEDASSEGSQTPSGGEAGNSKPNDATEPKEPQEAAHGNGADTGDEAGDAESGAGGPDSAAAKASESEKPLPQIIDPGMCGGVMDAADDAEGLAAADAEAEILVRQAIAVARRQQAGSVPAGLESLVESLNAAQQDWRAILREFIDSRANVDYSWNRPNRRMLGGGIVMPGSVPDGISHLIVAIDTSGSIAQATLAAFADELSSAFSDGCVARLTVLYADTRITRVAEFTRGDDLQLRAKGGGGTDFAPVMAWVRDNAEDVSALVYFTDMRCGSFGKEPACPVLWAAYGAERLQQVAPFGEVIQIDPEA